MGRWSELAALGGGYTWGGVAACPSAPTAPYDFSSLVRKRPFCPKKLLRFHNRMTVSLLLLSGMGLCVGEKRDFLISFSKLQMGKTTGVNNIVLKTPRGEGRS